MWLSPSYRSQRNWGTRVREVVYQGLRLIEMENRYLRIGVLAGKGADIVELNVKSQDLDLVWLAPGGVRDPYRQSGTTMDSQEMFREHYPGGWQEMFPNAGPPAEVDGVRHGQHGEVHARPWEVEILKDSAAEVVVKFSIESRKVPCRIEKTFHLQVDHPGFRIEQRLVNLSQTAWRAMWGHHITFGAPFLMPGSRIHLPDGVTVIPQATPVSPDGRRVSTTQPFPWPYDPGNGTDLSLVPEPGMPSEMVFLSGFGDRAMYEIERPDALTRVRVAWDGARMPYLWFWQEFGAPAGYPWYGRLYTIGLEPCTSMPGGLHHAIDAGTAMLVGPAEERPFWLELTVDA